MHAHCLGEAGVANDVDSAGESGGLQGFGEGEACALFDATHEADACGFALERFAFGGEAYREAALVTLFAILLSKYLHVEFGQFIEFFSRTSRFRKNLFQASKEFRLVILFIVMREGKSITRSIYTVRKILDVLGIFF